MKLTKSTIEYTYNGNGKNIYDYLIRFLIRINRLYY